MLANVVVKFLHENCVHFKHMVHHIIRRSDLPDMKQVVGRELKDLLVHVLGRQLNTLVLGTGVLVEVGPGLATGSECP